MAQLGETQTNAKFETYKSEDNLVEKRQIIYSREDENCKSKQGLINPKEHTEERDKSGDNYFRDCEEGNDT